MTEGYQSSSVISNQKIMQSRKITGIVPILYLLFCVIHIPFTDYYTYDRAYQTLVWIDVLFFTFSIICAIFHINKWSYIPTTCFVTVVVLNFFDSITTAIELEGYYKIYLAIIVTALLNIGMFSVIKK